MVGPIKKKKKRSNLFNYPSSPRALFFFFLYGVRFPCLFRYSFFFFLTTLSEEETNIVCHQEAKRWKRRETREGKKKEFQQWVGGSEMRDEMDAAVASVFSNGDETNNDHGKE